MEIRAQLLWMVGYAVVMVSLALNRYRKVAESGGRHIFSFVCGMLYLWYRNSTQVYYAI